tara:strand:+ start:501 stop:1034 length:534 start_codon:yes stop_codon:yes gene_type:complete
MMKIHKKLKEALKKHNYEVILSANSSEINCIKASFPERKQKPSFSGFGATYQYIPELDSDCLFFRIGNGEYSTIQCPRYSLKEVLFMDIEKVCDAIGYSQDLISFSLNDKDVDQKTFKRNILEDDLTDEEKEKQEVLEGLCELAKKEGFSEKYLEQSKFLGLQDAYDVLQDMYLSEI